MTYFKLSYLLAGLVAVAAVQAGEGCPYRFTRAANEHSSEL